MDTNTYAILQKAIRDGRYGAIRAELEELERRGLYRREVSGGLTTWTPVAPWIPMAKRTVGA